MHHPEILITSIQSGEIVILMDDEDRENEGDLIASVDHLTPEIVNFMLHKGRGLLCLAITSLQASRLHLPLMVKGDSHNKTAFTVSVDAAKGITSGVSAFDRTQTIKVVSHPQSLSQDIVMPGHVFPIIAKDRGVLERKGHTEGSIDLMKLAGLNPAAVLCEILKDNGEMARLPDLKKLAKKHHLKIGSIADLVSYLQSPTNNIS